MHMKRSRSNGVLQENRRQKGFRRGSRLLAGLCAALFLAAAPAAGAQAEELPAGYVRSIYTNEPVTAAQAGQRPIAVMMPTDRAAQPSYGIGHAKVLYEIMEEG